MAISLKRTADLKQSGVKLLVYGLSGAGKTCLIPTLPNPIILSAEGGLLSLSSNGADVPYIEIKNLADLKEAYLWLTQSSESAQFESVALDSISEVAEVLLSAERQGKNPDPRAAYGEMQDKVATEIRNFRDLPGRHVYFTAKAEKSQQDMGRVLYAPAMPGNKAAQALPYFFDEVLALRLEKDEEGTMQRALLCQDDGIWLAKDRSGRLDPWEAPDLGAIIQKITGGI